MAYLPTGTTTINGKTTSMWGGAGSTTGRVFGQPGTIQPSTPIASTTSYGGASRGVQLPGAPTPSRSGPIVGAQADQSYQASLLYDTASRNTAYGSQGQSQSYGDFDGGGGGGGGYSPAMQALAEPGMPPQQASLDPGVKKGIMGAGPTLFDFGGPNQANPALGKGNPAMEGLLRLSQRRPTMY